MRKWKDYIKLRTFVHRLLGFDGEEASGILLVVMNYAQIIPQTIYEHK